MSTADWMSGASPPSGVRCQTVAPAGGAANRARPVSARPIRAASAARGRSRQMGAGDIQTIVGAPRDGRPAAPVVFRSWPAETPVAAVILLHGLGGHSERFHECGRIWSSRGLSLYAP